METTVKIGANAKNNAPGEILEEKTIYRRAKTWQIFLYPAGATASSAFMFLMILVSYFAAGVVGLGTVVTSMLLTSFRVFDGINDPIIGLFIDKTNGKFGKVRPFIILGFVLMAGAVLLMYFTAHLVPSGIRIVYFALVYILYEIGNTFYGVARGAGAPILTNDPKQRPLMGGLEAVYNAVFFALGSIYLSSYLAAKHGGLNNAALFQEFAVTVVVFASLLMPLTLIAIWSKDRIENFGTGKPVKITFKDMWPILKGNRPLQLFIVAASVDKLSIQISSNQVVNVMLFGIVIGNFALLGSFQTLALIPNILIILFGIRYAAKLGTKRAFIASTWLAVITYTLMFLLLWLGEPAQIRFDHWGFMTVAFTLLYIIGAGSRLLTTGLISPMLPDIVDYETYRSDRFTPGIIATIYSLIDKNVSSLAQAVVGVIMALIGFKAAFPDVNTPYSDSIFWATVFLYSGVLVIGWGASLIAMKFYRLDKERMAEIQRELAARSQNQI